MNASANLIAPPMGVIGDRLTMGRSATLCVIGKPQKLQKKYNLAMFGTPLKITKKLLPNYSLNAPGRPPAIQNYKKITQKLLPE